MRTIRAITFLICLVFVAVSCEDYIEIDDLGGTSDLTGTWDITSVKTATYQSMVLQEEQEQLDAGTLTFNSNGSGSYSLVSEDVTETGSFDWFENDDKVILNILTITDSITSDNLAIAWDVVQGGTVSQEWRASLSYYSELDTDPYGNLVDWTDYLMKYEIVVSIRKQ